MQGTTNQPRPILGAMIEQRSDGWYDAITNCPLDFDQVEVLGLDGTLRS